jgi:hypothetical protein
VSVQFAKMLLLPEGGGVQLHCSDSSKLLQVPSILYGTLPLPQMPLPLQPLEQDMVPQKSAIVHSFPVHPASHWQLLNPIHVP